MNTWSEWTPCTDLRPGWQVRKKGHEGSHVFEYKFQNKDSESFTLHNLSSAKECDRHVCRVSKNIRNAQVAVALMHYHAVGGVPPSVIGKLMRLYGIHSTQQLRECASDGFREYNESVPDIAGVPALDTEKLIDALVCPIRNGDSGSSTDSDISFYSL